MTMPAWVRSTQSIPSSTKGFHRLVAVVDPGRQRAFLGGRRWPIVCSGAVVSRQLRRLAGTEGYEVLLEFLAHYMALVVPDPVATEGSFWVVETEWAVNAVAEMIACPGPRLDPLRPA